MDSRIPLELYRPIVECVSDRRTLLSLALSSKVLNVEAERVLYRTINNVHDVQSYTHILRHLISCPRVARLVRHIHFILRSYIGDDHEFWQLLPAALRSLPNLKTLVFRGIGECRAAQLPSDCAFQLEYLDWWCPSSDLSSFLASQRHLKTVLNLQCSEHQQTAIPSEALPELTTLSGNFSAVQALLPGRHVTNLHWISSVADEKNPDVSLLAPSLSQLQNLQLGGHFHRHPLGLIAEHLSNVEQLELFGIQPDDLGYLCRLPRLEELKLSSQWGSQTSPVPLGDAVTITKIFSGAEKLKTVDVALPVYWPLQAYCQSYERWKRGCVKPEIVNTGVCM